MELWSFRSPRTGKEYDYPVFRVVGVSAVVVFALTEKEEVVAIRQFRPAASEIVLELPGGLSDGATSPEDAAWRELLEETGYRAGKIARLAPDPVYFDPASLDFRFLPFLATECEDIGGQLLDEEEDIEVAFFPLSEWVDGVASGEIRTDAKSMATTFLALRTLKTS